MSLAALALRVATVKVLRDATYAGARVGDSTIDPTSFFEEPSPFIIVAVDSIQSQPTGRDLLAASKSVSLILDIGVGSKVVVEDGEGHEVLIPHTDAGMEVVLDLMGRQIIRAFQADQGEWSVLWRKLVARIEKVQIDRGASSEKGVRYAARQVALTLQIIHEPSFCEPDGVWTEIISLMQADPEFADIATLLETEIASPNLEGWSRAVADLGLRDSYSMGGEPLLEPPPQTVTGADIEFEGGSWSVDEQSIEDALGPNPSDQEEP